MSEGLPTDDQLRRLEQRVMTRIRRRAELPKRIATGVAVAAVFAGGAFLLPRFGPSGGGAGSSSGSAGGGSSRYGTGESSSGSLAPAGAAPIVAGCHAAATTAPMRTVTLTVDSAKAAVDACVSALNAGTVPKPTPPSGSAGTTLRMRVTASDLVVCRDATGRLQVFVEDGRPSTLCSRNGMRAP